MVYRYAEDLDPIPIAPVPKKPGHADTLGIIIKYLPCMCK